MRTVILSTNDNPDYISYLPYVQKAWNMLGWNTLTFYLGDKEIESTEQNRIEKIYPIEGYRDETVVQVARLLGGIFIKDDQTVMTGDIDMIPLRNYWNPEWGKITCYGRDLSDKHYPICYIAMPSFYWRQLFFQQNINTLLEDNPKAKSKKFDEWWQVDQDIITYKLMHSPFMKDDHLIQNKPIIRIDRGLNRNYAKGRVDRGDWERTITAPGPKIDAHMPRPFNLEQTERVMKLIQP